MAKHTFSYINFVEFIKVSGFYDSHVEFYRARCIDLLKNVATLEEMTDLRKLDVGHTCEKYRQQVERQQISTTPWVLHTFKQFLMVAVGDFIAYSVNPERYIAESSMPYRVAS